MKPRPLCYAVVWRKNWWQRGRWNVHSRHSTEREARLAMERAQRAFRELAADPEHGWRFRVRLIRKQHPSA